MVGNKTIPPGQSIRVYSIVKNESASPRMVDLVFIVDESRSMENEHEWIKTMVVSLERELRRNQIGVNEPNLYALVGFGNPKPLLTKGRVIDLGGSLSPFGNSTELVGGVDKLAQMGDTEDGYGAIDVALDELVFRKRAARQFILASDEERDVLVSELTYNETLRRLNGEGVRLNVIVKHMFAVKEDGHEFFVLGLDGHMNAYTVDERKLAGGFPYHESGYQTTYEDYVDLAFHTSGGAWDLNELRKDNAAVREAFTKAFVQVKVEEIAEQLSGICEECNCTNGHVLCVAIPAAKTEIQCKTGLIPDLNVAISPASIDKFTGEEVSFSCSVTNTDVGSEPSLTWSPIPPNASPVDNNLVFSSVTLDNTGEYTCDAKTATGRYGKATARLTVTDVTPTPPLPGIHIEVIGC